MNEDKPAARITEAVEYLNSEGAALLDMRFCEALLRYLQDHIETGGFLRACLENDFQAAALRAHPSLRLVDLKQIALAISVFPAEAKGSRANVSAWIAARKQESRGVNSSRQTL